MIDELSVGRSTLQNVRAAIPQSDIGISLLGQNALAQFQTVNIDGDTISNAIDRAKPIGPIVWIWRCPAGLRLWNVLGEATAQLYVRCGQL